jgi:hypothetical protein
LRSRGLDRRMRDGLLVPAEVLFEGLRGGNESLAVQRALGEWLSPTDEIFFRALDRANAIRNAILHAEIIAYEIDADANDENVIEIFARLNQQGVRLRPGDLAAARLTGQMTNFRVKAREALMMPEFRGFAAPEGREEGVRGGAFVDTDLLIRAALFLGSGAVRYRDAERRKIINYQKIELAWDATVEGFKRAVLLYRAAGIPSGEWLPYRYLLFAPSIAAARGHKLDAKWVAWALVASMWRHYVSEVDTKLQRDANLADKGDVSALIEHVKMRAKRTESVIPVEEDLQRNIVSEGAVCLALLIRFVTREARSFPSGKLINRTDEPLEVHCLVPRTLLDRYVERDNLHVPDRLGNLTLLTRSDNESLGETPPDVYLAEIERNELTNHLILHDPALWRVEGFKAFCEQRERELAIMIRELLIKLGVE